EFYIFDFCGNFEYFNENPRGALGSLAEPLGKRLFKARLDVLTLLASPQQNHGQDNRHASENLREYGKFDAFRQELTDDLHQEVAAMNLDNFIVRTEREHVAKFADRAAWDKLNDTALGDLRAHVAGLPSEREAEHITAKLFDLICLNLQLALLQTTSDFVYYRDKVIELAHQLEGMESIPAVRAELALIQELQT